MALNNSLTGNTARKVPFSATIQSKAYQGLISNTLKDPKRVAQFVTAITSAVSANPKLQECDAGTVLSAGLLGEALNLSPSPQLGMYYIVPYGGKAQFQLGYKGYIQLAVRSGQYKKLNVLPIKQGELIRFNPLEEEIEVNLIEDESEREKSPTIGYYAMFEYLSGFRKAIYWSREKMETHAKKYSKAFNSSSSFWQKDFDAMACKTMLRQLISKWGIMSVEMERAVVSDMAVIGEDGTPSYADAPATPEPAAAETLPEPEPDDFASIMMG